MKKNGIQLKGEDEIFVRVPKWPRYYCSNYGRLVHENKNGSLNLPEGTIQKKTKDGRGGYVCYRLSRPARKYRGEIVRDENGKPKSYDVTQYAHILVSQLFLTNYWGDDFTNLEVHHKDRNRRNNYYKNLIILPKEVHKFMHSILKMATYNDLTGKFKYYKDIEVLAERIDASVPDLLSTLKINQCLFRQDGWDIFQINDCYVAVQFGKKLKKFSKRSRRKCSKNKSTISKTTNTRRTMMATM